MARRPPLSQPPAPKPVVLVVGGGPFQVDIVRTAKEIGAEVAVADRNPAAVAFALADHPLTIDIVDHDALIEAARAIGATGVVSAASDIAMPAVARVGEALGLRAASPDAVARCRDKRVMYEAVKAAGLAVPETVWVESFEEARAAVDQVGGLPVVVKPRSAAGGRGVSVVRDAHGLEPALERAKRYGAGGLVQTFVGGHAVGVEAFFWDGEPALQIVMDDQFQPGFVSPVGHSLPSMLSPDVQQKICRDVVRFAAALGLGEGPANFDLRFSDGETVLIEVNPRLGGNSITDLVRAAWGVDLSAAMVRAALGHDPSGELRRAEQAQPTASRLIVKHGSGVARVADPFANIEDRQGIALVELAVRDGEPFALRVDEHVIVGRCVVGGASASEATQRAAEVARAVSAAVTVVST